MKKFILNILLCIFIISLLIFSKGNILAARNGLALWANSVVPTLFPFFVAIELLNHTNIPHYIGKLLNAFMKPLFNVPGIGAYIFTMGLISGYPTGAKLIRKYRNQNLLTKVESERLITFSNNSGMLFIIGTVGITMFQNNNIGILLLITHILSCISVGIIFRFWNSKKKSYNNKIYYKEIDNNNSNILYTSITNAINTCLTIGGFIVLFSIITSILKSYNILNIASNMLLPFLKPLGIDYKYYIGIISGILEITNGIAIISNISNKLLSTNIILVAFLLGVGGISVAIQIYTVIQDTDISIVPYILGKFLQGILASIYTYLFIKFLPFFNYDLINII